MNTITTVTIVAGAVIVIGGVAYAILRRNATPFPKKDVFQVKDILEWVDQITPSINVNPEAEYFVKVLPTEDTQEILTRRTKDAYAMLFVEKFAEKIKVLGQTVIIAKSLAPELRTLNNRDVIEMPIKF